MTHFWMKLLKAELEVNQQEEKEFKSHMIWQIMVAMLHSNRAAEDRKDVRNLLYSRALLLLLIMTLIRWNSLSRFFAYHSVQMSAELFAFRYVARAGIPLHKNTRYVRGAQCFLDKQVCYERNSCNSHKIGVKTACQITKHYSFCPNTICPLLRSGLMSPRLPDIALRALKIRVLVVLHTLQVGRPEVFTFVGGTCILF